MSDSDSTRSPDIPQPDAAARSAGQRPADSSGGGGVANGPSSDAVGPQEAASESESALPADDDHTVISTRAPIPPPDARKLLAMQLGDQLEGERLGHFELQGFIGGGGMGAVFRALDTRLNRTVAVKVLSTGQQNNEETERRFQNEAQSVARLDHENIARVYYVGEDRGLHYIVFEYIEGENIRDLVHRGGPFSLFDAIHHMLQISEALVHASERDVVHRDIKPSNILITPEGRAKLVDMGLARLHQVEHSDDDLTASGVTLGTFDYISPEQARDPRSADVRSDLYSLGCTFFFMLTGRPPFPEGTMLQKLLRHQGDVPPDPREFRPELPEEVSEITSKLLAKTPRDRYQRPQDLIGALIMLAERIGLPLGELNNTVWVASPSAWESSWRRHLPWAAPAVLLLVIVLIMDHIWGGDDRLRLPPSPRVTAPVSAPSTGPRDQAANSDRVVTQPNPDHGVEGVQGPKDESTAESPSKRETAVPSSGTTIVAGENVTGRSVDPVVPLTAAGSQRDPSSGSQPATDTLADSKSDAELSAIERFVESELGLGPAVPPRRLATDDRERAETQDVAAAPAESTDVLIVAPEGGEGTYPTLWAAATAARSGDVVELRYNGRRSERPIMLGNRRLTIRGGEGFAPQVVFRPSPNDLDPSKYPRSMLTVTGGELNLVNVDLQLEVPRSVEVESWSLIETRSAKSVRLEQCSLTVRNAADDGSAYHAGVAFFDVQAAPGSRSIMIEEFGIQQRPVTIRLKDCVARGEATFLHSAQSQPIDFFWDNGLLVTSERFLTMQGGHISSPVRGLQIGRAVQIELHHLTAVVLGGLLSATTTVDTPYQMHVEIKCSDSIVMADDHATLIEQHGVNSATEFKELLAWNGTHNFYEGFYDFLTIRDTSGEELERLDFRAWQDHWNMRPDDHEDRPQQGVVVWKRMPTPDRPLHDRSADDYALSDRTTDNPARGGASDGRDAGLQADLLPAPSPGGN